MKVITIANRKGGTGKTTTTFNLGYTYALQKKRILFIDLDSQGNLTDLCGLSTISLDSFKNCEIMSLNQYVDILPATKNFPQLENEINQELDRNAYLKTNILPKLQGYDFILIDTAPALSIININALCISDMVYVVIHADNFSLMGLNEMKDIIEKVKGINSKIEYKIILNESMKNRTFTEKAKERLVTLPAYTGIEIPHRQHVIDRNAMRKPSIDLEDIHAPFSALAGAI